MIIKIEERGKELIFDEQISKKKNTRTLSLSPEFATIFQASRILEIIRHETSHRSKPVNLTNLRNIFPILIDQFHRAMKRHISSAKNIRMNDFNPRAMPWSRAILSLSLSFTPFLYLQVSPSCRISAICSCSRGTRIGICENYESLGRDSLRTEYASNRKKYSVNC